MRPVIWNDNNQLAFDGDANAFWIFGSGSLIFALSSNLVAAKKDTKILFSRIFQKRKYPLKINIGINIRLLLLS